MRWTPGQRLAVLMWRRVYPESHRGEIPQLRKAWAMALKDYQQPAAGDMDEYSWAPGIGGRAVDG